MTRIALRYFPVLVLGPGERYGLWTQGCSRRCPGCMARHFQASASQFAERIAPEELARDILSQGARGVTISGGEPFEQADKLKILLRALSAGGIEDIIVYSGFDLGDLVREHGWIPKLVGCLIDGPFRRQEQTDDAWRGSANQRATIFGDPALYEEWLKSRKGALQVAERGENLFLLGIPRIGDAEKLLSPVAMEKSQRFMAALPRKDASNLSLDEPASPSRDYFKRNITGYANGAD